MDLACGQTSNMYYICLRVQIAGITKYLKNIFISIRHVAVPLYPEHRQFDLLRLALIHFRAIKKNHDIQYNDSYLLL